MVKRRSLVTRWQKALLGSGIAGLAVVISACQIIAPQPVPAPRLLPDPAGVNVANSASRPSADSARPSNTVTIMRDSLRDSLALTGRVVPSRATQLMFRGTGTVISVDVVPGQAVEQGASLAEFAPD